MGSRVLSMSHFRAWNGKMINITLKYLLAHFIAKNFKKSLELMESYDKASFLFSKWCNCPKEEFFQKNHYNFHVPFCHFHGSKSLKNLLEQIQSYNSPLIFGPKSTNCSEWDFFWKNYQNNFDVTLGLSDWAKFLKNH